MKNKKLYSVLCAVIAVLVASLACNAVAPATPTPTPFISGVSNIYMATDVQGTNQTTVFSPNDDFYVFFDVTGVDVGTNFQSRWYGLDIEGQDPNEPFQTIDYAYEEGKSNIYFQLTNSEGWPVGNYKVEIYMNDVKVGEQLFSVQ
jgi:hypothetical protein